MLGFGFCFLEREHTCDTSSSGGVLFRHCRTGILDAVNPFCGDLTLHPGPPKRVLMPQTPLSSSTLTFRHS